MLRTVRRRISQKTVAPLSLLCLAPFASYAGVLDQATKNGQATSDIRMNALARIPLGGIDQWILVQGEDESAPVLLFLHGGPGVPIIPFVRDVDAQAKLKKHFVMVYWDQRGAGKSYSSHIPVESMNIDQFLTDTYELVEVLRARFNVPKVYLVGHSWGSIIGALTVSRHPELFYAYVGISQAVEMGENEKISYRFAFDRAVKSQNHTALHQLTAIGPPPYSSYREMLVQRKWVGRFGGGFRARSNHRSFLGTAEGTLTVSGISFMDTLQWLHGPYFSIKHLWDELQEVNLFQQAPTIAVPVYFLEGRHDYYAPSVIAQRYYQTLEAPKGKAFIWFDNSAHAPPSEEPGKFYDVLVNRVLEETYR